MAVQSCDCNNPLFPNLGRPGCVIEQKALAFPIIVPRYDASGARNTIDLTSLTLGADILALIGASTAAQERLYPFPGVKGATWERTETQYEEMPDGEKFKLDGVGGVRTLMFMLVGKDSVGQINRELEKGGCSDLDFYYVDVAGNLWGILDNTTDTTIHGYELTAETWDVFKTYATDTTRQKLNVSWDLDKAVCESKAYAIESTTLGYNPITTLVPNISGFQTLTCPSNTTLQTVLFSGFGAAGSPKPIVGLAPGGVATAFTVYDETAAAAIIPSGAVESPDGTYLITVPALTATNIIRVEVTAAGFDIENATVEAI